MRILPCLPLLLLAAACTGKGGEGTPGPQGSSQQLEAGSPCSVDVECREGLACERSRRICICTSDASCPKDRRCNPFTGLCVEEVPGCKSDEDCRPDQWCDADTRVCRTLRAFCETCDRNAQCGPGNRCVKPEGAAIGFCGAACRSDADCPLRGTHCRAGQCIPDTSCADLSPCTPDTLDPCDHHADCRKGSNQLCEAGRCVAARSGCGYGQSCDPEQLVCLASCASDGDCAEGRRCRAGACHPIERCATHLDCPFEKVCSLLPGEDEGVCTEACRTSADCPLGTSCVVVEGRFLCEAGCREDADCFPDRLCEAGRCVGGDGRCQTSEVCDRCERCVDGRCTSAADPERPLCAPCDTEGPDPACGAGWCWQGGCAPPCAEGCPRGFACRQLSPEGEGGAMLELCVPVDGHCDQECL